jgi:hypothetical protein
MRPTQPPIQRVPWVISATVKRPRREADRSPLFYRGLLCVELHLHFLCFFLIEDWDYFIPLVERRDIYKAIIASNVSQEYLKPPREGKDPWDGLKRRVPLSSTRGELETKLYTEDTCTLCSGRYENDTLPDTGGTKHHLDWFYKQKV